MISDRNKKLAAAAFRAYETLLAGGVVRDLTAFANGATKRFKPGEADRILDRAAGRRRGGSPKRSKAFEKELAAEEARSRRESVRGSDRAERDALLQDFEKLDGKERVDARRWVWDRIPAATRKLSESKPENEAVQEALERSKETHILQWMRRYRRTG